MSKNYDRFQNKSNPSRWDSPDKLTANLGQEIQTDLADLADWFWYCKRNFPTTFRGWSMTQFKIWNEQRIAELETSQRNKDYGEALLELEKATGNRRWCPTDKKVISIDAWIEKHGPHPDDFKTGRCQK